EAVGSYYYLQDGGIQQSTLQSWQSGWKQGSILQPGYLGFRTSDDALVCPLWADTQPALAAFTPLLEDALGDHLFDNPVLDLLSMKIAATDERLYFALQVAGNSFPTSSGFTYFAYMPVIVDPAAAPEDNPTVYGLMYTVEMGGIIGPALYKITGSGFNGLSRLGDIEHSIVDNTLILSCAMADLLADADFSSWFDPQYPIFATTATTSRINLVNGIQQADMTEGIKVLSKAQYLDGANRHPPTLSNASLEILDTNPYRIRAQIDYQDQDHNVPRMARLSIDGLPSYTLTPAGELDFAQAVTFTNETLEISDDWEELTFEISHGGSSVEYILANPVSNYDANLIPIAEIALHPNPVRASLHLKSQSQEPRQLRLYNLRGQLLQDITLNKGETELDLQALPSGVYFLHEKGFKSRRFVKL
ncbi:MAG: T9SS type A sorting domain-containing protein, partial [Candidatus Cloacimonetes bacterium]|nr:T9SS type A sorting domain-containing protein [Candidatus Cloacimonadota bacterium]